MDPNALIGTRAPAPLQGWMLEQSERSWDYFWSRQYPRHAFGPQQWPAERGPIPTALPYVNSLVTEGAEFIFRNGCPAFSVPKEQREGLEEVDAYLHRVIRRNCLAEQWVALAESAGNQGALAVKFSVDLDDPKRPVRISFLDVPQECRVWFDPHDCNRILMARIQYPFRDPETGEWRYFREEWTEDLWARYVPRYAGPREVAAAQYLPGYSVHLGDEGEWELQSLESNPFGLVPVEVIRNRRAKGNPLGVGDCWGVFSLIDRIALALHGEDRASQLHSEPTPVVTNADLDDLGPRVIGEPWVLTNEDPSKEVQAQLLEPRGTAREYSHRLIDKWEDLLWARVGYSRVKTESVTNKGNMTALAFSMTFARSISSSDRKRELWGNSGMVPFFRKLLLGVSRLGGVKELLQVTEDLELSCEWPPYFEPSPDDVKAITDRTVSQVGAGLLPRARGAERVARAEKVPEHEIPTLLEELEAERQEAEAREAAAAAASAAAGPNRRPAPEEPQDA